MSSFDPLGLRPNDPLERWRDDAERREREVARERERCKRQEGRMAKASGSTQLRAEFATWRAKQAERERIVLEAIGEEIAKFSDELIERFERHIDRMRGAMLDAVETRFTALEAQIKAVESRAKGTFEFAREKKAAEIEDMPNPLPSRRELN
jgi:hypothetical protein